MAWYCGRCGRKRSFSDVKFSSKDLDLLRDFNVPDYDYICGCCYMYLENDSLLEKDVDKWYLDDEERGRVHKFYLASRHNPS